MGVNHVRWFDGEVSALGDSMGNRPTLLCSDISIPTVDLGVACSALMRSEKRTGLPGSGIYKMATESSERVPWPRNWGPIHGRSTRRQTKVEPCRWTKMDSRFSAPLR